VSKGIPILVIEDEEHLRMILEYNLKLNGFEVYLAENGPRGVELARQKRPELIDWVGLEPL